MCSCLLAAADSSKIRKGGCWHDSQQGDRQSVALSVGIPQIFKDQSDQLSSELNKNRLHDLTWICVRIFCYGCIYCQKLKLTNVDNIKTSGVPRTNWKDSPYDFWNLNQTACITSGLWKKNLCLANCLKNSEKPSCKHEKGYLCCQFINNSMSNKRRGVLWIILSAVVAGIKVSPPTAPSSSPTLPSMDSTHMVTR